MPAKKNAAIASNNNPATVAAPPTVQSTPPGPVKKVRVTAQQVAFLAVTGGTDAVKALHNAPGSAVAPATFDSALEMLSSQPQARAALEGIRVDLYGEDVASDRGRPSPKIGESRPYRVQQVGEDGDSFVRLPVSLLGLVKGTTATATFQDGQIIVTASKPGE